MYLKTLSDIVAGQEISLQRFFGMREFDAIQAGTSTLDAHDVLSDAFLSGARGLYVPRGIYRFSGDLAATAAGSVLRGDGGGEYVGLTDPSSGNSVFERQDAGTTGSAVLTLGEAATAEKMQFRPANYGVATYDLADYPAASGNVGIGLAFSTSSQARHCTAFGFPVAAFQLGTVAVLERCNAWFSDRGYALDPDGATDGSLINCIGASNYTAGADLQNNFWQVLGGRWEWNARHGIIMGAESSVVGALFDRNGFAGIWATAAWGKVIASNYFSRNGCGGDGVSGRWGWSTPGTPSYVAVPAGQSCHIQIDGDHALTVTGNRYRAGQDDSDQGANAPQFVYGGGSATGPGASQARIVGNTGDSPDSAVQGYCADYGGVTGSGNVAGGPDTELSQRLNTGMDYTVTGTASAIHAGDSDAVNVSSVVVNVPRGASGRIIVRASTTAAAYLSEVYFATNAADTGYTTSVVNIIGTEVSSAAMAQNTADQRYNKVTITLKAACWVNTVVQST